MTPPPLAICQARMGSTRLPRKMLLDLGGQPLVMWAVRAAWGAFGREHVVCAIPASAENDELAHVLETNGAQVFRWDGPEWDVLGRFWRCAHGRRWDPDSVIVRVTPDDWAKSADALRRVANGERLPVELGGEAFTLAMLDAAYSHEYYSTDGDGRRNREHITYALFPEATAPLPPAGQVWTIDTAEDLEAARRHVETTNRDLPRWRTSTAVMD